jgi:hypothetical protein
MDNISSEKILVKQTGGIQSFDGKTVVVLLPGNAFSQLDNPPLETLPVSVICILKIESSEDKRFCSVIVEREFEFNPNVTEQTIQSNGVFYNQPDIQIPSARYLNQEQIDSIVPNNPSISHSREAMLMLIIS